MSDELDLAIIGSGPAGLGAAVTASRHGLKVKVFDEQPAPGGQIYRAIEKGTSSDQSALKLLGADYHAGAELVSAFRASKAHYRAGSKVWGLTSQGEISLAGPSGASQIRARRVLIAAGAMERPMPVPGWTLPGVMTAGAAQIQMKTAAQVPDVPFVIAGSGPLLYLVAWQLLQARAPLIAVLDTTSRNNYLRASRHVLGTLPNLGQLRKGLGWIWGLKRAGVQIISDISDLRIEGGTKVEVIHWRSEHGKSGSIGCQLVLLHQGVVPNYQLASLAGCDVIWDDVQMCWRTVTDDWGATNQDAIAVAGDCSGISGAIAARHQGNLAGLDTAFRLGVISAAARDAEGAKALRAIRRQSGFRRFLDDLYRSPRWITVPQGRTVVCRCEEVTASEIRRAAEQGAVGANQLKFYTRAGMGRCQGRMCGLASAAICADVHGSALNDVGFARVRPPVRPITIGELAEMQTPPN